MADGTATEAATDAQDANSPGPPETNSPVPPAAADLTALHEALGADLLDAGWPLDQPTAVISRDSLQAAAALLRGRGYNQLTSATAVDFMPASPRFHVVYHFTAIPAHTLDGNPELVPVDPPRRLRIRVPVGEDDATLPSLCGLYPTANWHERETWDMFGIQFAGHPDLRRILMPEEFEGHPLRKDYPLRYEEVAFTSNRGEVSRQKDFATE